VELRPNGSLGTCIPNGVTTFLLYTSRRTTQKEYARGEVHENHAECLFSLLKPYLRVFRGVSKCNLPGYVGFFQLLCNFRQYNACEQAELILRAALDPAIINREKGEFVTCFDHFDLLQTAINLASLPASTPLRARWSRSKKGTLPKALTRLQCLIHKGLA
jgi:hypothetical protein